MTPINSPNDPLSRRAHTTPTATALIDARTDTAWTYQELSTVVDQYCAGLTACGVDQHEHIGILMESRLPFVFLYFATNRLGTVCVPLNTEETEQRLITQTDHAHIDRLICDANMEPTATAIHDDVLSIDPPSRNTTTHLSPTNDPPVPVSPLSLPSHRLILFTSGTTGRPKAVPVTRSNLFASAIASAFRLGILPTDHWLCCLPLYHMGGLAPVSRSTLYGTPLVLQDSNDPIRSATLMESYPITGISLVPTQLHRLLNTNWAPPDSIRFVLLGGAPATQSLIRQCHQNDIPVYPTYGMTETTSQIATADPTTAFEHPGTVGRPLFFTEVTILQDHEPVPTGTTGEITVSGPTVTPQYYRDPDATHRSFGPYGLRTGDLGYIDNNGLLYIEHRLADHIITGGETVDPEAVADVLTAHPAVEAAAIVGIDDPEWGQRVGALVVTSTPITEDELRSACEPQLATYEHPKIIKFTDALPRTASGTIDRDAVRESLAS